MIRSLEENEAMLFYLLDEYFKLTEVRTRDLFLTNNKIKVIGFVFIQSKVDLSKKLIVSRFIK